MDDQKFQLEFAVGGSYARLRGSGAAGGAKRGYSARGACRGFSSASRKRLLDVINSIDRSKVDIRRVLFITLTYPSVWPEDWHVWKDHLRAMLMRLERRFPGVAWLWRLEFQARGAPHFHILLFNVERVDISWLSQAWFEVVGSEDPRHLAAGTQVSRVKTWGRLIGYVSKYVAKSSGVSSFVSGRAWGYSRNLKGLISIAVVDL